MTGFFHSILPLATIFEVHTIQGWLKSGGYGLLFLLLVSCGLGVPIPEDVPLIASGILVYSHRWSLAIAAPVAWLGIMCGDCILYTLGFKFGEQIVHVPVIGKHITLKRLRRAEDLFRHYGVWMVAIGRLFMGIRGAMVVTAGTSRFKFGKFLLADGLAAVFSGGMFMYLGYWGGEHSHEMVARIRTFKYSLWSVAGVLAVILIIIFFWRERKRAEDTEESASANRQP